MWVIRPAQGVSFTRTRTTQQPGLCVGLCAAVRTHRWFMASRSVVCFFHMGPPYFCSNSRFNMLCVAQPTCTGMAHGATFTGGRDRVSVAWPPTGTAHTHTTWHRHGHTNQQACGVPCVLVFQLAHRCTNRCIPRLYVVTLTILHCRYFIPVTRHKSRNTQPQTATQGTSVSHTREHTTPPSRNTCHPLPCHVPFRSPWHATRTGRCPQPPTLSCWPRERIPLAVARFRRTSWAAAVAEMPSNHAA